METQPLPPVSQPMKSVTKESDYSELNKNIQSSRILEELSNINLNIEKPQNIEKTFQEKYTLCETLG